MVLTGLFLLCMVLAVWGLVESGKGFLDAFYVTLQLITLNAGLDDGPKSWKMEIARFGLAGCLAYTILMVYLQFAKKQLSALKLKYRVKGHYVISGLGDRGMALARDLIKNGKTVAAIEIDPGNPHIKTFIELGGIIVEGDARENSELEQAAIRRAAHLFLLTGADISNLEILHAAKAMIGDNPVSLKCHVHIANRENRALFEEGGVFFPPIQPNGLQLCLFNVYENAAIALFQAHTLGDNADTVASGAEPVRLLIAGLGRMGEAVLLEAMQLGHFCNQVPIEITVLGNDAKSAERHFLQRYREVSKHFGGMGLGLWNLHFIDSIDAAAPLGRYTDILACHDDEDMALVFVNDLWERWQSEENQRSTRFFLYSSSGRDISNKVIAFGNFSQACSEKAVIAKEIETMAKAKHEDEYNKKKLKDENPDLYADVTSQRSSWNEAFTRFDQSAPQAKKLAWQSLSLLKQASNLTEIRHYGIKLHALGLKTDVSQVSTVDTTNIDLANYPWLSEFKLDKVSTLIACSLQATRLDKAALIERIDQLAKSEHNRWNAFHVLNNFHYGEKDELKRSHDCLLNWDDLTEKKYDTLKWDYLNIYQMFDVLSLVESGVSAE